MIFACQKAGLKLWFVFTDRRYQTRFDKQPVSDYGLFSQTADLTLWFVFHRQPVSDYSLCFTDNRSQTFVRQTASVRRRLLFHIQPVSDHGLTDSRSQTMVCVSETAGIRLWFDRQLV